MSHEKSSRDHVRSALAEARAVRSPRYPKPDEMMREFIKLSDKCHLMQNQIKEVHKQMARQQKLLRLYGVPEWTLKKEEE